MLIIAGAGCSAGGSDTGNSQDTGATVTSPTGTPSGTNTGVQPPTSGSPNMGGTAGAPSGGNGVTSGNGNGAVTGGSLPCDAGAVVKSSCQTCHGATPIGGAPMSLVTLADFTRDYTAKTTTQLKGMTMKMYQLARIRINGEMGTAKMPQGGPLSDTQFAALNSWLTANAPAGTGETCTMTPAMNGNPDPTGLPPDDGTTEVESKASTSQCDLPGANDPLVAREEGETCYNFQVHGQSSPDDTSKFTIPLDESYNQFYYAVPWPAGSVATRFGSDFDNLPVLHHWLMFSSISPNPPGTVATNVTGTTLGENAELLAGWAVGGCTTDYGPDIGTKLPDDGAIMIQWHHFNSTGAPAQDGSKVQICVVPAAKRKNIAGLTFLGTEDISIPPMGQGTATSDCTNNSGGDITILGFTPHMHTIGTHMQSIVMRANGGKTEMVFDKDFVFNEQVNYREAPFLVLKPGDTVRSTCTWTNPAPTPVGFGQSTHDEMCYQFTVAYPYGALNNGVLSLIGATNTCW